MKTYKNTAVAWKKLDKNGKVYVSFKAERDIKKDESIALFANDKGGNPARPDFRAYEVIEDEAQQDDRMTVSSEQAEEIAEEIPF